MNNHENENINSYLNTDFVWLLISPLLRKKKLNLIKVLEFPECKKTQIVARNVQQISGNKYVTKIE